MMPSPARPLALVGLMGAGKSAVARVLGERLGAVVADLDAYIEAAEGCRIGELFEREGEAYFRRREGEVLRKALTAGARVVACGGGVVLDPAHRALLRDQCDVIWLEVSPAEAARRIGGVGGRPLLAGAPPQARLESLLAERGPLYAEIAHRRVDTQGRTPDQVADVILAGAQMREGPGGRPGVSGGGALCALAAAAMIAATGCAPMRVPIAPIEPVRRVERYGAALERREARGRAVDAQVLLWAESPVGTRLPGAEGRLLLAAPDAFRLRVASLFGTALDLGARGESLSAYVPSRRRGMMLDAIRDSLGIARPGGLAFRALTATWRPPDEAWRSAAWDDSLMRVWWLENGDTLALAVGSTGLPVWTSLARPNGAGIRVDYRAWDFGSGVAWPATFVIEDRSGAFRLSCKVSRVRFPARADSLRLVVPIPAGVVPMTLAQLRRALERLGTL